MLLGIVLPFDGLCYCCCSLVCLFFKLFFSISENSLPTHRAVGWGENVRGQLRVLFVPRVLSSFLRYSLSLVFTT